MKLQFTSKIAPLFLVAVLANSVQAEFDYYAKSSSSTVAFEASLKPIQVDVGNAPEISSSRTDLVLTDGTDLFPSGHKFDYFATFAEVARRNEAEALDAENNDVEIEFASAELSENTFLDVCEECECCKPRENSLYASVNFSGSFAHLRQGGFNTIGFFGNQGPSSGWQANENTLDMGATLGVSLPRSIGRFDGSFRVEVQGMWHDVHETRLNGFPGFPGPVAFFYRTRMTNRWSAMGNVWYDIPLRHHNLEAYFGGGIGAAGGTLITSDLVVGANENYDRFAWQVGCGLTYHYNNRLAIDLGYRFFDFGTANVPMVSTIGSAPAGNYAMEVTAHQVTLALRFKALQDFLPHR